MNVNIYVADKDWNRIKDYCQKKGYKYSSFLIRMALKEVDN